MRALVVGATGMIGRAVADALAARGHEVLRASRKSALFVDLGAPASIRELYARAGKLDAVVSCAGDARPGALGALTDADLAFSLGNKLMGQVNLVRFGVEHVRDGGVFLLTAGVYGIAPPPGVTALAMVNGALESFARAAALDLPRGLRVNTISPPWLYESAALAGNDRGAISAADNARYYADAVEGKLTGQVIRPA